MVCRITPAWELKANRWLGAAEGASTGFGSKGDGSFYLVRGPLAAGTSCTQLYPYMKDKGGEAA